MYSDAGSIEKRGNKVSKRLKVLIPFLLVIILLIIGLAGTVFAAGPNYGDCPSPDCPPADCPMIDCPRDGEGLKFQNGDEPCQKSNGQCQFRF